MQIKRIALGGIIMTVIMFSGCSTTVQNLAIGEEKTLETGKTEQESVTEKDINMNEKESFNAESNINDVIHDSVFDDYGRLIFPVDMEIEDNLKLKDVSSILPWYSEVNTDKTVEIVNYMKNQAMNGEQIFYPIYSEEEMQADADKKDTGLFFFRGNAGARMAAWLGSYGTAYFGEKEYPAPAVVIMQYTGLSQVTGMEPPTYACVGTSDGIASYRSMENYIFQIQQNGPNTKIEVFKGLSHGFGLGEGTVAEGWIDRAISFWEDNMNALDKR